MPFRGLALEMQRNQRMFEFVGTRINRFLEDLGDLAILAWRTTLWTFRPPADGKEILRQMVRVGVASIPVVCFIALFTGGVMALHTFMGFSRFRAQSYTGGLVAISMMREVAPVFTALIVTGRVGSLFAAELSSMRTSEQIDALEAMGTDPIKYLFVPRVIAGMTMLPLLEVLAVGVSLVGGRLAAVGLLSANPTSYDKSTFHLLELSDFVAGPVKSVFFGLLLTLIACAKGFRSRGGAVGVGEATTRAVVTGSGAIVLCDFLLSKLLF